MFGDLGKIMKLMSEVKTKLPELKEKLANSEFVGDAGDGAVVATVNGKMAVLELKINPELVAAGNAGLVEDLSKAAIATAQADAAKAAESAMKELTGGMDIPGLDGLL